MGKRKRESAEATREANKNLIFAKLNNCPTSPRKMRLVADQVRGEEISKALGGEKAAPGKGKPKGEGKARSKTPKGKGDKGKGKDKSRSQTPKGKGPISKIRGECILVTLNINVIVAQRKHQFVLDE